MSATALLFLLLFALPLSADIYDRLDELPRHLRSGGVPIDGIPSMTNPQAVSPEEALYLGDDGRVLGVLIGAEARAYPHNLGWKHEIINDQVGDRCVCVTFCPLTSTGLVFDATTPDSHRLELGVSGLLLNSNLVMYDRSDEQILYPQMIHAAISGPRQGEQLQLLPVVETTWGLWKKMHPHTRIAQASTGLERYPSYIRQLYPLDAYRHYPYGDYRTNHDFIMFPPTTARPDPELAAKEMVLGLRHQGKSKAYPFGLMPDGSVINDQVGGRPLLVLFDRESSTAIPYDRRVDGQTLAFYGVPPQGELPVEFADLETGSLWNMRGEAVSGPLQGQRLEQVPAHNAMWFAWSAHWPETELWNGEGILAPPAP
jgi:hypothetical protein